MATRLERYYSQSVPPALLTKAAPAKAPAPAAAAPKAAAATPPAPPAEKPEPTKD